MPIIPVSDLGAIGLVKDVALYDQPPNCFSEMQNARPINEGIESVYDHKIMSAFPMVNASYPFGLGYYEKDSVRYWIFADEGVVEHISIAGATRIITGAGATPAIGWQISAFQGLVVINNGIDAPWGWDGVAATAVALPNWTDPADRARVIRPFKQFLVALYITSGGNIFQNRIAWSAPAEPGTFPTTWDPNDDTNDAGWFDIADTPGQLLDCLPLGDANMIYKTDSIWGMVYTATEQVFRFYKVAAIGALGINCITAVPGGHVVLGNGDVYFNTGQGEPKSLVNKKIRDAIFARITPENAPYAFTCLQSRFEEVWICLPGDELSSPHGTHYPCTLAYTINYRTGAIGSREIPPSFAGENGFSAYSGANNTWATALGTWDSTNLGSWANQNASDEDTKALILVGDLYQTSAMVMDEFDPTVPIKDMYIERNQLAISGQDKQGNWIVDISQYKILTHIWPVLEVQGIVNAITIGAGNQAFFGAGIVWSLYDYVRESFSTWAALLRYDPAEGTPVYAAALRADFLVNSPLPAISFRVSFVSGTKGKVRISGFSAELRGAGTVLRSA